MNNYNPIPGIEVTNEQINPTIKSPNSVYEISFWQTRDSLLDVETYKAFIDSCVARFRHSATYTHYKGRLIDLGLDRCQFHGNITNEMATVEMHHAIINIKEICLIIVEHLLNTVGYVCSFDVVDILKEEHKANRIPLVMLAKTPHQLNHSDPEFFIPYDMCFGKWWEFLEAYHTGITQDIAFKLLFYFKKNIENNGKANDAGLLTIRNKILDWSGLNECNVDKFI